MVFSEGGGGTFFFVFRTGFASGASSLWSTSPTTTGVLTTDFTRLAFLGSETSWIAVSFESLGASIEVAVLLAAIREDFRTPDMTVENQGVTPGRVGLNR